VATTFDDDERSTSGSRPIDLYIITTPTQIYRLTSNQTDVVFGIGGIATANNTDVTGGLGVGVVYTALTMARGPQMVAQDLTAREISIFLPITHPIVQRYASTGVPEREVTVAIYRFQTKSSTAFQSWSGVAQSLTISGRVAEIKVPAVTDDALKVKLPVIAAQRLCNHVLYDRQCTISRTNLTITQVIIGISGSVVTTILDGAATRYVFGDVEHVASGELRMILSQTVNSVTLNAPFSSAVVGDQVRIAAGCDHTIKTCRDKFLNVVNFGGMPHMNLDGAFNPWAPGGLGLIVQT
jgi:uncharacterized phage protein (TIGR02218 family)